MEGFMSLNRENQSQKTLEQLCRLASQELDSKKLAEMIEEIDRLLDEKHNAQVLRRAAMNSVFRSPAKKSA
jgi:hypothetical protein